MSFLTSPPEVIASLLHTGPGSAPMLAAAASWDGLATELGTAAQSFSSITSALADQAWRGPASAAMMQTAARYSAYLSEAATQAQTAAAQAQAAADAFDSTVAAIVHPAFVAANRNRVVQLAISNLFGQNAPAIAAAESDYERMWAQDVTAMIGYHGGASAAVAQLPSWEAALQSLPAQASAAIASIPVGSALSSATSAASNPITGLLATVEHYTINVINAPTELLFGFPLIGGSSVSLGGTITGGTATAPLTIFGGTEPLVNASVGTGSAVPLLVDTGSEGLVIPFTKVGGLVGLLELGLPTGFGISGYSGGLDYIYATYNAPVNFGGGLVTARTPVDVELFAFPTSVQSAMNNGLTFQSFFATDGAAGVLGVGPNATGPGPSIATQALPGSLGQGLLINEVATNPYLQFGAAPTTGVGSAITTLTGAPITDLTVTVNGGTPQTVASIVDSGGVFGTLPASLNASPGDTIVVSANGHDLYYYVYNTTYFPTSISSGLMNTGYAPYAIYPTYINYGADTMTLYN